MHICISLNCPSAKHAGVGKTAIVEGLAQRIVAGDVPPGLLGSQLLELDLAALAAGCMMPGEFEVCRRGLLFVFMLLCWGWTWCLRTRALTSCVWQLACVECVGVLSADSVALHWLHDAWRV